MMRMRREWARAAGIVLLGFASASSADQAQLEPLINPAGRTLELDWPMLSIGTAEYPHGPTGLTVFRFARKVLGAVDVRGGGPGTVNTDYLRLGYTTPEVDAVVFAGGSWYGLEATTAAASALKDDGLRNGDWVNIGLAVGAIIYDLGERRLNEIYPDKRLAQAAFRGARPGTFPLGAYGAGRFAVTGGLFGCNAHSGQGGAFRQIGELKIAAFTVVNALGVVTDREGRVVACYADEGWPEPLTARALLAGVPASRKPGWRSGEARRNTTVSLVVVNATLDPAELQRLAVQVHTSMSRSLQPFATEYDGDVLYAVATGELEDGRPEGVLPVDLGVAASEVMWDAVLASVPEQLAPVTEDALASAPPPEDLRRYPGEYRFSDFVSVRITARGGRLYAQATGARDAYAIERDEPVELRPLSGGGYAVPGRYPLRLRLTDDDRLIVNPGHWQQTGVRM